MDLRKLDVNKVTNEKLKEALLKAKQDSEAGRPYQRPTFNPFLYNKSSTLVSEVTMLSKTDIPKPAVKRPLLTPSYTDDIVTFNILTSIIVGLQLQQLLPKCHTSIVEPTDIERFRIPPDVDKETHDSIVGLTMQCLKVFNSLSTKDVYTRLSVLPMSLSIEMTVSGTTSDWKKFTGLTLDPNSAMYVELNSIIEQIKSYR